MGKLNKVSIKKTRKNVNFFESFSINRRLEGKLFSKNSRCLIEPQLIKDANDAAKYCNSLEIPVLFTAQRAEFYIWQLVMKMVHQKLIGDIGNERKYFRHSSLKDLPTSIRDLGSDLTNAKYLVAASGNMFADEYAESTLSFLSGSYSGVFGIGSGINPQELLKESINDYFPGSTLEQQVLISDFVAQIYKYYEDNKTDLPWAVLHMIAFEGDSIKNLNQHVYISMKFGYTGNLDKQNPIELKDRILHVNKLNNTEPHYNEQYRVWVPLDSHDIKVIRFYNDSHKAAINKLKTFTKNTFDNFINTMQPLNNICPAEAKGHSEVMSEGLETRESNKLAEGKEANSINNQESSGAYSWGKFFNKHTALAALTVAAAAATTITFANKG